MRDVNLDKWKVTPHHTYFMHVQNSVDGEGVGLCLVQIGDGSEPCTGMDTHEGDNYSGHVLVAAGKPVGGAQVHYYRDNQFILETVTDPFGRHSVRLEPGHYQYRFPDRPDEPREYEVLVRPGQRVDWQDISPEGEVLGTTQRQVKFIREELVCQWDNSDGTRFSWVDVPEVIAKIAARIGDEGAALRMVSFASFCRPDILKYLRSRGLWVVETKWSDAHFAAAFHNLLAVHHAGLIRFKRHLEANLHLERNARFATPSRVEALEGSHIYLALARAAAVFHASTRGGNIENGLAIYDPMSDGQLGTTGRGVPTGWGGQGAPILEQYWNPRA